jgi:23S rRNA pseudouridine1911/1915/1917 synthase
MTELITPEARRLDSEIIYRFPKLSRSFAADLIKLGKVSVNGEAEFRPGYRLKDDDQVNIDFDPTQLDSIPELELPVIYEDDNCVVINKPAGILVHSKGGFNPEATVATWLRSRLKGMEGERAGIVHRLDRATSGVMICAKNVETAKSLQKQFADRKVKKTYLALIKGKLANPEAVIDMPIERNPKAPATFRVGVNGKPSLTKYRTIESTQKYSLLEMKPETGRTPQLRVHLAKLGHPIIGDELYGGEEANRLYLHALTLEITIPMGQRRVFRARQPVDFRKKLNSRS